MIIIGCLGCCSTCMSDTKSIQPLPDDFEEVYDEVMALPEWTGPLYKDGGAE